MEQSLATPLSEVSSRTDIALFRDLYVPDGVDRENIMINLLALKPIRFWAGLGEITVSGENDASDRFAFNIASPRRPRSPLARTELSQPIKNSSFYGRPKVDIFVDNTEVEMRIGKDESAISRQPDMINKTYARYLDRAVKSGLYKATFKANIDAGKAFVSLMSYGPVTEVCALLGQESYPQELKLAIGVGAALRTLFYFTKKEVTPDKEEVRRRFSLTMGCDLERYLIGTGLIATSTIVSSVE